MAAAVARVVQTRTNGIPALSILSWKLIKQLLQEQHYTQTWTNGILALHIFFCLDYLENQSSTILRAALYPVILMQVMLQCVYNISHDVVGSSS